ncbi:MAG: hypothetical protein M1829_004245 [Trizodia sp. TS-e1964]|nr:MAG: hypothetical protein M1829_004245 [Trizodia sp. TS-e1964]
MSLYLVVLLGLFLGALNASAMTVPALGNYCTGVLVVEQLGHPEMLGCVGKYSELVVLKANGNVEDLLACGWYTVAKAANGVLEIKSYPLGQQSAAVKFCRLHPSSRHLDCTLDEQPVESGLTWAPARDSFPQKAHLRPADMAYLENGAERMNFMFSDIKGKLVSNPVNGEYAVVCSEGFDLNKYEWN